MQRRNFLKLAGASALTPLFSQLAVAAEQASDAWAAEFAKAETTAPWTYAYRSANKDLAGDAEIAGRFPAAVQGLLYRNGPAVHQLGSQRYHHWFDGDGMIQRFAIGDNQVRHLGKIVRTSKYQAEAAAGKRLFTAFGTNFPGAQGPTSPDSLNVANTSVLALNGELLALWEGGSAYSLDPDSLQTRGPKVWRDDLAAVPFSAHPRVDPDGTIWNFGVSMLDDVMVLYQIAADGNLRKAEAVKIPQIAMVHDFAVTDKHLVFLLPPLVFDRDNLRHAASYLDAHVWRPELGMRVLVVDKSNWSKRQWLELPAGFLFHVGNAWEDAQGIIRMDYIHTDQPSILFRDTRDVMRGQFTRTALHHIARVSIDTKKGKAVQELLPVDSEFPRIDPRLTGYRHQHIYHATETQPDRPGFSAVARTHLESGKTDSYSYGAGCIAEEHIFVPQPGSAAGTAGWILGTSLDLEKKITRLSCFASDRLADGPVAQASLPYALPLGLHGNFVKA
ncbi:carotenoid oxygenase family protein [Undibacterium sp.]|jgi:all-trans-8'-apo-beta-carotenal 15,15'-oxygenase|uniref:carotenoid oxygenase family protein n=1 Tax=Undibacterium sp. TaxID=1914977 RepID=UPI002C7E3F7A|nr:carotenoid oxygenase family protein [Undibacterium sp.]HTD05181.1 carotenoid oxygenase family protein [Undibacterium sp.]